MRNIERDDVKLILKLGLAGVGAVIVGIGSARFVNFVDSLIRPEFIVNNGTQKFTTSRTTERSLATTPVTSATARRNAVRA